MTPAEQEALSNQHFGWWCVPLESGKIAVFEHPMTIKIVAIADSWNAVVALQRSSNEKRLRELDAEIKAIDLLELDL